MKSENNMFSKGIPLFQDIFFLVLTLTFVKVIQISSLHINQRCFLHSCLAVQNRGTEPKSNLLEPQLKKTEVDFGNWWETIEVGCRSCWKSFQWCCRLPITKWAGKSSNNSIILLHLGITSLIFSDKEIKGHVIHPCNCQRFPAFLPSNPRSGLGRSLLQPVPHDPSGDDPAAIDCSLNIRLPGFQWQVDRPFS